MSELQTFFHSIPKSRFGKMLISNMLDIKQKSCHFYRVVNSVKWSWQLRKAGDHLI